MGQSETVLGRAKGPIHRGIDKMIQKHQEDIASGRIRMVADPSSPGKQTTATAKRKRGRPPKPHQYAHITCALKGFIHIIY